MRDAEKLILDDHLHRVIIKHIETLQRYIQALMTRRKYIKLRTTIIAMQVFIIYFDNKLTVEELVEIGVRRWVKFNFGFSLEYQTQSFQSRTIFL